MVARSEGWSPLFIARLSGLLILISIAAGGYGEAYVPGMVTVPSDAAATAKNILAMGWMYRVGFAAYIVEALCDATLSALFYLLLKPAGRELALVVLVFRIISTAAFAAAAIFYYAPVYILNGAKYLTAFSPEQID